MSQDFAGTLVIERCDGEIRDISLEMSRVEKVRSTAVVLNEKTQIQMLQSCDGDVPRGMELPFNMILPRYYSCPSFSLHEFEVAFEVAIQVTFSNGFKVSFPIPIAIVRL